MGYVRAANNKHKNGTNLECRKRAVIGRKIIMVMGQRRVVVIAAKMSQTLSAGRESCNCGREIVMVMSNDALLLLL